MGAFRRSDGKTVVDRSSGLTLCEQHLLYVSLVFDPEALRNNTRSVASYDGKSKTIKSHRLSRAHGSTFLPLSSYCRTLWTLFSAFQECMSTYSAVNATFLCTPARDPEGIWKCGCVPCGAKMAL